MKIRNGLWALGGLCLALTACKHDAGGKPAGASTEGRQTTGSVARPAADWIRDEELPPPFRITTRASYGDRLRNTVRAEAKKLQRCYLEELEQDPQQHGELVLVFIVSDQGSIEGAEIEFSSLSSPGIEPCVLDVFRALQLPPPPKPDFTVRYPLVFTSGDTPLEVAEALQRRYHLERDLPPETRAARQKREDKAPW